MNDNELVYMYQQNKSLVLNEYLKINSALLYYIIGLYNDDGYESYNDDFYQVALIKLGEAFESYSFRFKVKFTTYFTTLVKRGLIDFKRRELNVSKRYDYLSQSRGLNVMEDQVCYRVKKLEISLEDKILMKSTIEMNCQQMSVEDQIVVSLWLQGYTYREIAEMMEFDINKGLYVITKLKNKIQKSDIR